MHNYFSEARQTLWLALPFVANQVLQMSVITIDSVMAGADSELTLAAVAQGTILFHFVLLGIIGMLVPMTAMIAKAHAKGDGNQLRELFQQSLWLALPLGLLGFVLMLWIPSVMHLVGVDEKIIPPATQYLRIIAFTVPLMALFLPVRLTVEGMGHPEVMMAITATSIPLNIIGNYALINGVWFFPKMGAAGIAAATLFSTIYLVVVVWWYALRSKRMKKLTLLQGFSAPIRSTIMRFIHVGVPSSLTLLMESGMFTAVVLLSGKLGVEAAAANQIAFNYASNAFMIPLGISMALTTRIGMAMGEGNGCKVRAIGVSGVFLGAGFMMLSVMTIAIFGAHIAELYTKEAGVIKVAATLLTLAGIFQIFDGIQVCSAGALRGLEETQSPMRYAALGYWVLGIPLAIVLAFFVGMGAPGLWWGLVVGLATTAVLCLRKFLRMTQQTVIG